MATNINAATRNRTCSLHEQPIRTAANKNAPIAKILDIPELFSRVADFLADGKSGEAVAAQIKAIIGLRAVSKNFCSSVDSVTLSSDVVERILVEQHPVYFQYRRIYPFNDLLIGMVKPEVRDKYFDGEGKVIRVDSVKIGSGQRFALNRLVDEIRGESSLLRAIQISDLMNEDIPGVGKNKWEKEQLALRSAKVIDIIRGIPNFDPRRLDHMAVLEKANEALLKELAAIGIDESLVPEIRQNLYTDLLLISRFQGWSSTNMPDEFGAPASALLLRNPLQDRNAFEDFNTFTSREMNMQVLSQEVNFSSTPELRAMFTKNKGTFNVYHMALNHMFLDPRDPQFQESAQAIKEAIGGSFVHEDYPLGIHPALELLWGFVCFMRDLTHEKTSLVNDIDSNVLDHCRKVYPDRITKAGDLGVLLHLIGVKDLVMPEQSDYVPSELLDLATRYSELANRGLRVNIITPVFIYALSIDETRTIEEKRALLARRIQALENVQAR